MAQITMTYPLAMAAAQDAGNRHARAAGRKAWAVADWNHACEMFARLWPEETTGDLSPQDASEPQKGLAGCTEG